MIYRHRYMQAGLVALFGLMAVGLVYAFPPYGRCGQFFCSDTYFYSPTAPPDAINMDLGYVRDQYFIYMELFAVIATSILGVIAAVTPKLGVLRFVWACIAIMITLTVYGLYSAKDVFGGFSWIVVNLLITICFVNGAVVALFKSSRASPNS